MAIIRHISRKVNRESFISRLPALFPFIKVNPNGNADVVSAIESPNGCYGLPVPNIYPATEQHREIFAFLWPDLKNVDEKGIPYRVLMDKYYEIKHGEVPYIKKFVDFIDYYIGLVDVREPLLDRKICDLAPRQVYLAQVNTLYQEYRKLQIVYNFYHDLIERKPSEKDATICCLCERFERMGGDVMVKWLKRQIQEAQYRARSAMDLYIFNYDQYPSLNFDIMLCSTSRDMGVVTPLITTWKPKETYPVGTLVIYNGELWKAKGDGDGEYVNGSKWDDNIYAIRFNEGAFECLNDGLITDTKYSTNIIEQGPHFYRTGSQLISCRRKVSYINEIDEQENPPEGEDWLFYYRVGQPVNIEYQTDENGNLIVEGNDFIDGELNVEEYLEKMIVIGDVITNISCNAEEKTLTFEYAIGTRLIVDPNRERWPGDVSEKTDFIIKSEDDDGNVMYRLRTDTPFTAMELPDDIWNPKLDDVDFSKNINYGNHFVETYRYDDKELIYLIESGDFDNYINDIKYIIKKDEDGNEYREALDIDYISKYRFDTSRLATPCELHFGDSVISKNIIMSESQDFIDLRRPLSEIDNINFVRNNYDLGMAYPNEITNNVFINRGTTSVFERHFKLSEIKTLEDMENYANGGFFNIVDSNGNN